MYCGVISVAYLWGAWEAPFIAMTSSPPPPPDEGLPPPPPPKKKEKKKKKKKNKTQLRHCVICKVI